MDISLAGFLQPLVVAWVFCQCKVGVDGPASLGYKIKRKN